MQSTSAKVKLYDESLVQALGECTLQCKFKGKQHLLNFNIVRVSQQPLLSGETCTNLGLITVHVVNNVNRSVMFILGQRCYIQDSLSGVQEHMYCSSVVLRPY